MNTLILLAVVGGTAIAGLLVVTWGARVVARGFARVLAPVVRAQRERDARRRARLRAAIRAERAEVRSAWAAEKAAREEEA